MTEPSYSRRQLIRILRVRAGQVRRWERLELFPRRRRYGWPELVRGRALCRMESAAPPRRLAELVRSIALRLPELADPLLEVGWRVSGGRLEVLHGGVYMDAFTGQMRLPFPSPPPAPHPPSATADEAEQWFVTGLALEQDQTQLDEAAAAYARCLELDPGFTSAYINLGTLHYHGHNYPAAEACYRYAVRLDPAYALAHFNLGNVLDETGRLEAAVAAYEESVRLTPDYADAHYNLALAYQRLGARRRAVPHWRRYLELDRASAWAGHARSQLKAALALDPLRLVSR